MKRIMKKVGVMMGGYKLREWWFDESEDESLSASEDCV